LSYFFYSGNDSERERERERELDVALPRGGFRLDVLQALIARLRQLLVWMKVQKRYKFYGSSLLIVYDGEREIDRESDAETEIERERERETETEREGEIESETETERESDLCRVVMIDFARVIRSDDEIDADYVYGLENLLSKLQSIVEIAVREREGERENVAMSELLRYIE
jgi:hypothetical protein